MESAEQPANNLHKRVGKSLQQLGHHQVSTVPPNEGPVFAEDLKGMVNDIDYRARTALEEAISGVGGSSRDRSTDSINPDRIALNRAKSIHNKAA